MAEQTGHAAFHLKHVAHGARGNRGDRRAILRESMRHLDVADVARHAQTNSSIVPADAHMNTAFVNDGAGGYRVTKKITEVLDYGDAREKRVRRKISDAQQTTNLFVVHLPKTLCEEVQDFYPRFQEDGSPMKHPESGEQMKRSRFVARHGDEAMRYFRDAVEYLSKNVIPGGAEAIHGWATNFDESTPHIQLMADPFAGDPNAPGDMPDALRTEHSHAYRSHRAVRGPDGRQISGQAKMRSYQEGLREHMLSHGWLVEQEVAPRHGQEQCMSEYQATKDAEARNAATLKANRELMEEAYAKVAAARKEIEAGRRENRDREAQLDVREAELPRLRRKAVENGRSEGHDEARDELDAQWRSVDAEKALIAEMSRRTTEALNVRLKHAGALVDTLRAEVDATQQADPVAERFMSKIQMKGRPLLDVFREEQAKATEQKQRTVSRHRLNLEELKAERPKTSGGLALRNEGLLSDVPGDGGYQRGQ